MTGVYEYSGSDSATNLTGGDTGNVKETDSVYDRSLYEDVLGLTGMSGTCPGLGTGNCLR